MSQAPWQQGRFDGLCGLYSVINAVHHLLKGFTETDCRRLFVHMIQTHGPNYPEMVWRGVDFEGLWQITQTVPTYLLPYGAIQFTRPFKDRDYKTLESFLDDLRGEVAGKSAVAIVGLVRPRAHWTVIADVLKRSLFFKDSCGLKEMTALEALSLDGRGTHLIDCRQTIIVRRLDP